MDGTLRSSCPAGSTLKCAYVDGADKVVMYLYSTSTIDTTQFQEGCTRVKGTLSAS
jgi:hypothetical protein